MDFEKDYINEKESLDVEEEFEKPELTKSATRDTDQQYFTNINDIYAKDAEGRAAVEELRTIVSGYSETTLYTNNYLSTTPQSVTLPNTYTDYDALILYAATVSNSVMYLQGSSVYNTSCVSAGTVLVVSYNDSSEYLEYTVTDTTTLTLKIKTGDYVLYKVIGVKYGGGAVSAANSTRDTKSEQEEEEPIEKEEPVEVNER